MSRLLRPQSRDDFEIALICALTIERNAVEALLDQDYEADGFSYGKADRDPNAYTIGRLGNQNVVLAYMPGMAEISAAAVAASLRFSFKGIRVGIVVGVCGGVPTTASGVEVLLGDVIISRVVVQTDLGRQYSNKLIRKTEVEDVLGRANPEIRAVVGRAEGYLVRKRLKTKTSLYSTQISAQEGFSASVYPGPANDILYPAEYRHKHQMQSSCICDNCKGQYDDVCEAALQGTCDELGCDRALSISAKRRRVSMAMGSTLDGNPLTALEIQEAQEPSIHFGRMACGNQVVKSAQHRDRIAAEENVLGFEMESAGTWNYVPTIVIKSVCDYADSHKNKLWQGYAAATAAACTKAFLEEWRSADKQIQDRPEIPLHPSPLISFRHDRDAAERHVPNEPQRKPSIGLRDKLRSVSTYREVKNSTFWSHLTLGMLRLYRELHEQLTVSGRDITYARVRDYLGQEKIDNALVDKYMMQIEGGVDFTGTVGLHKFCALLYIIHMELQGCRLDQYYYNGVISDGRRSRYLARFALFVPCCCGCQGRWNFSNDTGLYEGKSSERDCIAKPYASASTSILTAVFWTRKMTTSKHVWEQNKSEWLEYV